MARQTNKTFELFKSNVTPIANPVTMSGLMAAFPHCFAGVKFFSDAAGTTQVFPTAGTVAIDVETINNEGTFEPAPSGSITAAAPQTVNWDANTKSVRATPAAVSGNAVSHYQLVVTQNR